MASGSVERFCFALAIESPQATHHQNAAAQLISDEGEVVRRALCSVLDCGNNESPAEFTLQEGVLQPPHCQRTGTPVYYHER